MKELGGKREEIIEIETVISRIKYADMCI